MKSISNNDLASIIKYLEDYSRSNDGGSLRAYNRRRMARLMLPKLRRRLEDEDDKKHYRGKQGR